MALDLKITHKGMILVALPLVFEFIFVGALASMLHAAETQAEQSMRAKEIVAQANVLSRLYTDADLAMSNYCLTRSSLYADSYVKCKHSLEEARDGLLKLPVNSPAEGAAIAHMSQRANNGIEILDRVKQALDDDKQSSRFVSRQMYKAIRAIANVLDSDLNELTQAESTLRSNHDIGWNLLVKIGLAVGLMVNTLLMVLLARYFMKEIKGRLQVMSDNSVRLSRGQELHPPVSGSDEIAAVDSVFHVMAKGLADARRKERALLENARDMICSIGANGVFTEVSPASLAVLGYKSDDLLGQRYISLVSEEEKERTLEKLDACMQTGSPLVLENRLVRKDGTPADILWSGTWSGQDQSLFCVLHDITERKKMERLKQEFVQMVSHDLRMPLTALQMTLEMLQQGVYGELNASGQKRISASVSDTSRLINLINQLLEFERMESGKIELDITTFPLPELLSDSAGAMQGLADAKRIALAINAHDCLAQADKGRLLQVIINLVGNAIKFSPVDSTVTLKGTRVSDCLEVQVIDQGRGVPAEFKEKIFDRFEQVELNDSRTRGGSGLGLAICKAIVTEHGGEIGVDSNELGSTFWFRIPGQPALADIEPETIGLGTG